jgi:hypothetical protein
VGARRENAWRVTLIAMSERIRTGTQLAFVVVVSYFALTILRSLVYATLGQEAGAAAALSTLLTLAWVAVVGLLVVQWARRFPANAGRVAGQPVSRLDRVRAMTFALYSLACTIFPASIFYDLKVNGLSGSGESAQIGLFAIGVVYLGFTGLGLFLGVISLIRKEPKPAALIALAANGGLLVAAAVAISRF